MVHQKFSILLLTNTNEESDVHTISADALAQTLNCVEERNYSLTPVSFESLLAGKTKLAGFDMILMDHRAKNLDMIHNCKEVLSEMGLPIISVFAESAEEELRDPLSLRHKDLSDQKLLERTLQLAFAKNKLRKISKNNQEFSIESPDDRYLQIAKFRHELSSPLTVLIYHCEKILKGLSNSPLTQFKVLGLQRNIEKVLSLALKLKKIISTSRSTENLSSEDISKVNLKSIIDSAIENCEDKIHFSKTPVKVINNANDSVILNESDLTQVLTNLLKNSLESIDLSETEQAHRIAISVLQSNGRSKIYIEDTGLGISDEIKGQIFDPRFSTKRADKHRGLGLSICKDIIDRNHWHLELVSQHPARFMIEVPNRPFEILDKRKVLILEDDAALGKHLEDYFIRQGIECILTENGKQALAAIESEPIGLVVADLNLPDMDGTDLIPKIKHDCNIIFMTGFENINFRGNEAFISERLIYKPFSAKQLISKINHSARRL